MISESVLLAISVCSCSVVLYMELGACLLSLHNALYLINLQLRTILLFLLLFCCPLLQFRVRYTRDASEVRKGKEIANRPHTISTAETSLGNGKQRIGPVPQVSTFLGPGARPWKQWLVVSMLIFSDLLLGLLVWEAAFVLQSIWGSGPPSDVTAASVVIIVVWVVIRALLGLYPSYGLSQPEELRRQTYAVAATLAITAVFAMATQTGELLSRLILGLCFLSLLLVAPWTRYFVKWCLMKLGLWGKPVAILGVGEPGARLVRALQREWRLGFKPSVIFDFPLTPAGGMPEGAPYEGTVTEALELAKKHKIDTAIFAMPHAHREQLVSYVNRASLKFRHVIVVPDVAGVANSAVVARDLGGNLGLEIKHNLLDPWALRVKRVLDLGLTIVGGTLVLPLLLVISLLISLETRGHVFYWSQLMGRDGKPFWCVKFRTMVPDAEGILARMMEENEEVREEYGKYHKLRNDPRVTRTGRFLRRSSLDELPQLWHVLRGEMSLVGPRPYKARESKDIGSSQSEIQRVPPGISGLWQVTGRNSVIFRERVQLDVYYVRNWSVWLDLVILARTIAAVILRRGAY